MKQIVDRARLEALARTDLMDSDTEEAFDRFTRLVSQVLGVPVALISLVDDHRQFFKSAVGLGVRETPLTHSFCQHVVADAHPLAVADAREDSRLCENLAIEDLGVVAYCGVPLTDPRGHTLGSLCAIDSRPRQWSQRDLTLLRELAAGVMTEIELRVANRALAAQERESRLIASSALDAFVGSDAAGRIVSWNPAAEQLFGWRPEEAIGRTVAELIVPESEREGHNTGLARYAQTREPRMLNRPVELRALHRSGRELFIEMTLGAFDAIDGLRFHAVIRDVSVRHALEQGRAQLAQVIHSTQDAVISVDRDGVITSWNQGAERMYGYTAVEMVGRRGPETPRDAEADQTETLLPELLGGEFVSRRGLPRRRRDGSIIFVDLTAAPLRDERGEIIGATSISRDVTEHHRLAEDLAHSEERLRRTFEDAPIGMGLVSLDGRWLRVNRVLCEIVGYRAEELLALSFQDITHPDDLGADLEHIHRMLAGDIEGYSIEKRYLHRAGHEVWVKLSVSVVRDGAGEPVHLVFQIDDITSDRAAQAARDALEQRQATLLASLPDTMVILYDRRLRVSTMQGALVETRFDPSRFEGRPLSELVDTEQFLRLEPALRLALDGERATLEYPAADGLTYSVEVAPYLEDGEVTAALTVWRDITARLEQERGTRLLATIVEQSADAIIVKDRAGVITEWNEAAERLYGYTAAEMVGQPISILIPPERAGEDKELLAWALRGQPVRQHETVRLRKDGARIDVSLSISPVRDACGKFAGASVIAHDISERIARERARREAEERLRITVDHAPIGVALVELDQLGRGRIRSVNDALAEMVADPDPVASGVSLTSIVHPDDADAVRGGLMALSCESLARVELEVRCLHGDGTMVWMLLSGASVPAAEGRLPHQAVFHVMDIGERKRFEGQLQHLADHDALTGLYNRGRFESELERAVAHAARYGSCGGVMLIDLDGFKFVNDTMGHSYGDELVSRIGHLLSGCLRETDVVARIGGDEFAVIVAEAGEAETLIVADKVLAVLREHGIVLSENRHARVTASIGITTFDKASSLTPEELVVEADIAMYEAKEAGKNQACTYQREDDRRSRLVKRESWLERLRQATDHEGFQLLAQPITAICADDIPRFELLLRLRSEDGDLIPPGTFLYNAERFDLIQGIDRWVFGQALELLRSHEEAGNDISLSVNMSGKTLNDPDLLDDLATMIASCPIPRDRLVVEVTETAAITNIERAGHIARGLRELGVQFALDDFGAGFASFYYLKHLDFDFLKIDGEFVRSLTRNVTDQLVIKSVVDIARGLGAKTIAEFVGDDDALRRLRELGVDYGQGYHLGRPGTLDQRLPALAARR